jgi:DNA-binding CsgD family transcriptional regulator
LGVEEGDRFIVVMWGLGSLGRINDERSRHMPSRPGSSPPEDTGPNPNPRLTGGPLDQDTTAGWRAHAVGAQRWFGERDPGGRRLGYGDFLEGGVAVIALLAMLAVDVSPWLAIPLAVAIYIAVALLRPARLRREETGHDLAPKPPLVEELPEDTGGMQFPELAPIDMGPVASRFGLTRREQEILPLLAQRLTDREIAEHLSISHRTAMNHTANILGKLGLASRRDVAEFVARHALLPPSTTVNTPE